MWRGWTDFYWLSREFRQFASKSMRKGGPQHLRVCLSEFILKSKHLRDERECFTCSPITRPSRRRLKTALFLIQCVPLLRYQSRPLHCYYVKRPCYHKVEPQKRAAASLQPWRSARSAQIQFWEVSQGNLSSHARWRIENWKSNCLLLHPRSDGLIGVGSFPFLSL